MAAVATDQRSGQYHAGFGRRDSKGRGRPRVASLSNRNAAGDVTQQADRNHGVQLPRAASYTYLPDAKEQRFGGSAVVEIKGVADRGYATQSDDETAELSPPDTSPPDSSGWNTPDEHGPDVLPPEARDIVAQLEKSGQRRYRDQDSARSSVSTVASSILQSRASLESNRTASTIATTPASSQRPSLNKSFSRRFSGRSWYPSTPSSPSRSPSPTKKDSITPPIAEVPVEVDATRQSSDGGRRKSLISRKKSNKSQKDAKATREQDLHHSSDEGEPQKPAPAITRKGTFLRKKATRAAGLSKVATNDGSKAHLPPSAEAVPAVPALPKSFSTDRLPMLRTQTGSTDRSVPVPKVAHEKQHISPLSVSKKKDELWNQFRTLDADFSKFSSKSTSLKANVVRNALMPFLRTYAVHASNKTLRPEDLDRRTSILNKWWCGLIEMLHGRNNQSISGTDRPVILDGISGIMERPEWRLSPGPFCPLNERVKVSLSTGSRSNTSLGSSSSDFLTDSVHHNVRNIFVQNLSAQMAFVVDKMSLRNASASLVTFCGKACAYAFMFVPGMADVLVRLWDLPMDMMRRVLQESGIGKFDSIPDLTCTEIVSNFPPALHSLGFVSLMKYMRKMRTPPPLPLGTTHIQWWGHWTERWSGRESDLFYVFAKHFHVLATDFLPPTTTKRERLCSPGMLLVHAQILANLDATIHRDAHQAQSETTNATPAPTFDDVLSDPDAHANTLPVPPTNATRLMAENRLIMLIRDFLSERTADHPIARELFAQSFNDLLHAAARGTSMFDHSACYTLLDLLEEALIIMIRYESLNTNSTPLVDSDFWQTVCRKMIDSENTMTEIRLYAFLFTIWNMVVADTGRKIDLCVNLLLDPDVFESRFNHWCPMVRAYYMRLLCWRVGRYDGEEGNCDLTILEMMQDRLQKTWSHYLYLSDEASRMNKLQPETGPCHPAPGRRLLIVRTDNIVSSGGSFLTFDGLMRDSPMQMAKRSSSQSGLVDAIDARPESSSSNMDSDNDSSGKGIGGFLRKMIGGGGNSKTRAKSQGPVPKRTDTPAPGAENPLGLNRSASDFASPPTGETTKPAQPTHRSLSFKFSLEFHPSNKQHPQMRLFPPRLPGPAQRLLESHNKSTPAAVASKPLQPRGESVARARYAGRALAEWMIVVGECQSFFERRMKEGVPKTKWVETPTLGVEVFKRPS
ncbi:hypothetical protein HII31_03857 [Pseudocercospora fuligena]|uniref:DUF1765-domain-containing protein n=1 Tax=Pseudocercospora fuligena TaxID=685502 RepID=A0A8H6RLZ6_9PEZI|nr:hypothetical protein HII31_03857 [Pseudocercospora fuligena]